MRRIIALALLFSSWSAVNANGENSDLQRSDNRGCHKVMKAVEVKEIAPPESPFRPWFIDSARRIRRNLWWNPNDLKEASCTLQLDNGQVNHLKLIKPSSSEKFNRAVIEAVKKTRFRKPPDKLTETILVEFVTSSPAVQVKFLSDDKLN